jgi:hypothetical protein
MFQKPNHAKARHAKGKGSTSAKTPSVLAHGRRPGKVGGGSGFFEATGEDDEFAEEEFATGADVGFFEEALLGLDVLDEGKGEGVDEAACGDGFFEEGGDSGGDGKVLEGGLLEHFDKNAALEGLIGGGGRGFEKWFEPGHAIDAPFAGAGAFGEDVGADDALEEQIVFAVGELFVGDNAAGTEAVVDGGCAVVVLIPTGLEEGHREDAARAAVAGVFERGLHHGEVAGLEDVQGLDGAGEEDAVGEWEEGDFAGEVEGREAHTGIIREARRETGEGDDLPMIHAFNATFFRHRDI